MNQTDYHEHNNRYDCGTTYDSNFPSDELTPDEIRQRISEQLGFPKQNTQDTQDMNTTITDTPETVSPTPEAGPIGAATYSPEDNKLRIYPDARLDKETYDRVKAAGFKWAPKQELFVAPMWTPEREDLASELCGEIGDEDKSLVERSEERAERFEDYSEKRAADSENARKGVAGIADNIPLGQPILVGHHSEKRARKDAQRIENGMRKTIKMWEQSKYWSDRAQGAICHAKYKELPSVRARRIKTIEADKKRKQERAKSESERALKFWRGGYVLVSTQTGEKFALEICEANREKICLLLGRGTAGNVRFLGDDGHYWSAWDCLRPDGDRYKACPSKTVEDCRQAAERCYTAAIVRENRWIAHYDNRLAFERAMLAADGGTVADKTGPEKGGACKCWVGRGAWLEIVKVNKVSVSVADNWGNGGPDFLRTVPFDKLSAILSKADFDAMKAGQETPATAAERQKGWQEREHAAAVARRTPDPQAADVAAIRETLKAGVKVVSAPQLFPTPDALARRMVELADIWPSVHRVMEPSAGTGALLKHMTHTAKEPLAIEINSALAEGLRKRWPGVDVRCVDFLSLNGEFGKFDRIIMNPPFVNGEDIKHIEHARTMLRPGGRLVALCANGPRQQDKLKPIADSWEALPSGTFTEAGTGVNVALLVINAST